MSPARLSGTCANAHMRKLPDRVIEVRKMQLDNQRAERHWRWCVRLLAT